MAEALKTFFSKTLVQRLAQDFRAAQPSFDAASFVRQASTGLEELELMQRAQHIERALTAHLPKAYPSALKVVLKTLGPEHPGDELLGLGMAPFYYLPHTIFVAENGLEHFELSLDAQYELTKRFSCEWSIRAFIAQDPERTVKRLHSWANDPSPHVRRLISEGTRSRLPWASRVAWLDANPKRILELLELLKNDSAPLVRRSVANSLNDLSKSHPTLVVATCRKWLKTGSKETLALVNHALRTLVKKGHPDALATLGVGQTPKIQILKGQLSTKTVRQGSRLGFSFELKSQAQVVQKLVVDYRVHFMKARGTLEPKVFKLKRLELGAQDSVRFEGAVSFVPMTTRKHYPGRHRIEVLVNGQAYPLAEFELK